MRPIRLALLLTVAALFSGCFTLRSTIHVRPDGSGTVVETLTLSGPAIRMAQGDEAPLGTPEALAARAASLGDSVTLVGSEIDATGATRTTTYAFPDVTALRFRLPSNAMDDQSIALDAAQPPMFTFDFTPAGADGAATLHVLIPESAEQAPAPLDSTAAAEAANGLMMARMFLGEGRISVGLVAGDETVETDAAYRDTDGLTLFDVAFEPLLDIVEEHIELSTSPEPPIGEIRRYAEGRDGIRIQPPGTLTVRFR